MGIAQKVSRDFADGVRARGQSYFAKGKVAITSARPGEIVVAKVRGTEPYKVKLRMRNGRLHASCTCPFFGPQGEPCKHIWATILAADAEALLNAAPVRPLRLVPDVRYHTNGDTPPPPQSPPPVGEGGWPTASGGFEGQGSGDYRQIYPADRPNEGGYPSGPSSSPPPPRRPQPNQGPGQGPGPGPRPYYGPNQGQGPSGPHPSQRRPNQGPGRPNQGPGRPNQGPGRPNQGPGRPNQGPGRPNQGPGPHPNAPRGPANGRRDNQRAPGGPSRSARVRTRVSKVARARARARDPASRIGVIPVRARVRT